MDVIVDAAIVDIVQQGSSKKFVTEVAVSSNCLLHQFVAVTLLALVDETIITISVVVAHSCSNLVVILVCSVFAAYITDVLEVKNLLN